MEAPPSDPRSPRAFKAAGDGCGEEAQQRDEPDVERLPEAQVAFSGGARSPGGPVADTLASRRQRESVMRAARRATLVFLDQLLADPEPYLTRSRLAESIPAARSRSRQLDIDYEDVLAAAIADERGVDPTGDLRSRLEAQAAWSANRAARQVWLEKEGKADPRKLVDEAYDLVERGFA